MQHQNTSHAVMAQRAESKDSLDDFPTPPWATRAFVEHILGGKDATGRLSVLEPACGRGYMAGTLAEYFETVKAADVCDYGYAPVADFLDGNNIENSVDWVITNPPFKWAEKFISEGLRVARVGVAMLVRTSFIESSGRYERLFSKQPPNIVAQYVERVPMVKGRVDPKASTATSYAWIVWTIPEATSANLLWIPPSRKLLERCADYESR